MKRLIVSALVALLPTAAAASEPYLFGEGGVAWSFDRSNHDEVEFGDEPGGSIAGGIGWRYQLDDQWFISGEGQVISQIFPLHGRNDKREATADGRDFWLAGLTANVWPEYALSDRWSLYGGGGVRFKADERFTLDAGGRYYWTAPVEVDGADSRYDSFGPSFRLLWSLP